MVDVLIDPEISHDHIEEKLAEVVALADEPDYLQQMFDALCGLKAQLSRTKVVEQRADKVRCLEQLAIMVNEESAKTLRAIAADLMAICELP